MNLLLLLLISGFCFCGVRGIHDFEDNEPPASLDPWKKLAKGEFLDEDDLKLIFEQVDDVKDQPRPQGFPELNAKQRKFAVHPGFRSFYDPKARVSEGISDRDGSINTEEIAVDPFESNREEPHEKKAAHGPFASAAAFISGKPMNQDQVQDLYFTTVVAACSALSVFAIIGAGFCYHRVRRNSKASEDVEYPAYGVTGPGGKDSSPTSGTDRKLAQNAQMYHYQHQKQQMIAFDSANGAGHRNGARGGVASDCESDDGEEGDYTVYECPGLAPTGEMEVRNPLFQDDPTPKAK